MKYIVIFNDIRTVVNRTELTRPHLGRTTQYPLAVQHVNNQPYITTFLTEIKFILSVSIPKQDNLGC